ncbi:arginase family protein [Azospirillum sp. CT11-132]|uniref:arginase family protein n=1 Tax=Azospirillum sp. CT11-132 TaxID=3396317 RepID=UPI0039A60AAD
MTLVYRPLAHGGGGDGPVYVSFDVDCLDPVFAPGTGTPEVSGLITRAAIELLRRLAGLDVIGGDVIEVASKYDATTTTAQTGVQMLFDILCLAVKGFGSSGADPCRPVERPSAGRQPARRSLALRG